MAVKLGITLAYARSKGYSAALALGASMIALMRHYRRRLAAHVVTPTGIEPVFSP